MDPEKRVQKPKKIFGKDLVPVCLPLYAEVLPIYAEKRPILGGFKRVLKCNRSKSLGKQHITEKEISRKQEKRFKSLKKVYKANKKYLPR